MRNPRNTPTPLTIRRIPGSTSAAYVRAPLNLIRRIAKDPLTFPTHPADPRLVNSEAILTATYSKLYYKGRMKDPDADPSSRVSTSGWWYLVGYACDGSDVSSLLASLQRFVRS